MTGVRDALQRRLRQQVVCYWLQLRILMVSPFEGLLGVLFPLMFATATLLVYRGNGTRRPWLTRVSAPP